MENGYRHFFLLAAKLLRAQGQRLSKTPHQPTQDDGQQPRNIREPILDFTARFGEINPDCPIFVDEVSRGQKGRFLPFFPLFGESR